MRAILLTRHSGKNAFGNFTFYLWASLDARAILFKYQGKRTRQVLKKLNLKKRRSKLQLKTKLRAPMEKRKRRKMQQRVVHPKKKKYQES